MHVHYTSWMTLNIVSHVIYMYIIILLSLLIMYVVCSFPILPNPVWLFVTALFPFMTNILSRYTGSCNYV